MKYYSQKDPRYAKKRLGRSDLTFGDFGCFFVSMCNLAQVDPISIINSDEFYSFFNEEGLLLSEKLAKHLDLQIVYSSNGSKRHKYNDFKDPCIAVTMNGKYTHFYQILIDGRIIDTLDLHPKPRETKYRPYQYRHFTGYQLEEEVKEENNDQEIEEAILGIEEHIRNLKNLTK